MAARESRAMGDAIAAVRSGVRPSDACIKYGVSTSGLYRAMRRHNIPCTGKPGRRPQPKKRKR